MSDDEFGLSESGTDSDCDSEFIRELEACASALQQPGATEEAEEEEEEEEDGDSDEGWVDAFVEEEATEATRQGEDSYVYRHEKLLKERAEREAEERRRRYESSIQYPLDMFVKARYVDNNKEDAALFFHKMVCTVTNLAWLCGGEMRRMIERNMVEPGFVDSTDAGRSVLTRMVNFERKHKGVLCTYHPHVRLEDHGFQPNGGRFIHYGLSRQLALDNYRRGVNDTNKMLMAHDYGRFVDKAKTIVPEITRVDFIDHRAMWDSFCGWYELRHGTKRVSTFDDVFFADLHLANLMRNINKSIIDTYYDGDPTRYSAADEVTTVKLRRDSAWMINDYGTSDELEVVHRIERYVGIDPIAAVPSAFDIMNWENLYWYNKYPLEAIIAFNVVEPYKYMIRQVVSSIEDPDRSFFFRKHLEGPVLPEEYTVPIIPKDHFIEDVAGAWVWDAVERGGVESAAWQCYCRDTMHPCVDIVFEERSNDWVTVDLVVPASIGFDVVRRFKSGKLKSQTKEQVSTDIEHPAEKIWGGGVVGICKTK